MKAFTSPIGILPIRRTSPIIALINRKSGHGKGDEALRFLSSLTGCHTVDLIKFANPETLETEEKKLRGLFDEKKSARVIIGGGDGTVNWGLQILDKLNISAPVAILSLGVGNEVGGCLGWSRSYESDLVKFVNDVRVGNIVEMDKWRIFYRDDESPQIEHNALNTATETINPEEASNQAEQQTIPGETVLNRPENATSDCERLKRRPCTLTGFLSCGFDARITEHFLNARDNGDKLSSVFLSKLSYVGMGIREMIRQHPELKPHLKLRVNDSDLPLPEANCRSLQLMNVSTMADGVNFWGTAKSNSDDLVQHSQHSLNDGKLEICATKSIHHMNLIRLNLTHAIRVAQGFGMELTLTTPTYVEVDGESWLNPSGSIQIIHAGRRKMIQGPLEISCYQTRSSSPELQEL